MNRIKFLILAVLVSFTFTSCEDDEKKNKGLQAFDNAKIAPYVFYWLNSGTALDVTNGNDAVNFTLDTDDRNIVSHTLYVRLGNADGTFSDPVELKTTTSFPTTLNITGNDLAAAVGTTWSALTPANSFKLLGKSIDADGNVVTFDNLQQWLKLEKNAYNLFDVKIACPTFTIADVVGTWNVDSHVYVDTYGLTGNNPITITAHPTDANKMILSPILGAHNGDSITVTVGLSTSTASYTENPNEKMFEDFGLTGNITGVSGLVLPCANKIELTISTDCCFDNTIVLSR